MTGIRFWNYNKAPEDAFRGARLVHISIDGAAATPSSGVVIRKAPGDTDFDYGHTIRKLYPTCTSSFFSS